jgi:hypothetical protein
MVCMSRWFVGSSSSSIVRLLQRHRGQHHAARRIAASCSSGPAS